MTDDDSKCLTDDDIEDIKARLFRIEQRLAIRGETSREWTAEFKAREAEQKALAALQKAFDEVPDKEAWKRALERFGGKGLTSSSTGE